MNFIFLPEENFSDAGPPPNRHQVGGISRSSDGLFAQQEREPIRGRPAVRGKRTYGGRPGQRVEEQGTQGLTHTETQRGRLRTACGEMCVDGKNSQTTPATTSTSSIRQLLGAADTQTAHPTTFSTAPTHQLLGSANAETTPAGAPAAAADRTQRPDATQWVTVQGPVKEQQPNGMSHRGSAGAARAPNKPPTPSGVTTQWPGADPSMPLHAPLPGCWAVEPAVWGSAGRPSLSGWGFWSHLQAPSPLSLSPPCTPEASALPAREWTPGGWGQGAGMTPGPYPSTTAVAHNSFR